MSLATTNTPCFDLRPLPRPQRHRLVFGHFETLAPGEAFEIVNDHDPLGLLYQFNSLLPGQFTWDYRDEGPEQWRVVIGRAEAGAEASHVHSDGCGCGSGSSSGGCG